jgi:hypothetical protein
MDVAIPVDELEYRLAYHEKARSMLNAAIDSLLKSGWKKEEIRLLVNDLEGRLKRDPVSFADSQYTIRSINLKIGVSFARPLAVQIGIQEEKRIVFVRKVSLMTTEKN